MSWLTGFYPFFQNEERTDDFVDRLSRRHLVTALGLSAVVIAGAEYIGSPINCFTPSGYESHQSDFIDSVCFTQSLYYVFNENWNVSQPILGTHQAHGKNIPMRGAEMINYYKYAPVVLMLMCFFCILPHYIWQVCLNMLSGFNLDAILGASVEMLDPVSGAVTEEQADCIVDRLFRYAVMERLWNPGAKSDDGREVFLRTIGNSRISRLTALPASLLPNGKCLFSAYLFAKLAFVVNTSLILWGLSIFLDVTPSVYLGQIFRGIGLDSEHGTQFSGRFPIVTICQYTGEAQVHGKLLRMSTVCAIPFNVYYDKIFAVFYCLFVVVLILLVISIFLWLYKCIGSDKMFRKYLAVGNQGQIGSSLKRLNDVATVDLVFILRLIESNSDWLVLFNLVHRLDNKLSTVGA